MTYDKMERVKAVKKEKLNSIIKRIEQARATATLYGLAFAAQALTVCLTKLEEEVQS